MKIRKKKYSSGLLAVITTLVLLPVPFPVYADQAEAATDYIVRYKDNQVMMMEDDDVPFDVVDGRELKKLLREDVLEWYEEDGDAILFEMEQENELSESLMSGYYDEEQWNLEVINAVPAFQKNYLGEGVRIGIVDSGVNPHPDFGDRLLKGYNFTSDAEKHPEKAEDTTDEYGHGTKVAGLAAGEAESGYIGVAPGAEIVPLKCTDGKNVKISSICRAIYSGIDVFHCDVLNLSLGVQTDYQSLKEAVEYADEQGVVLVSAVGNGGSSVYYYPANYDSVIGVGSVDRNGDLYYRSNHNKSVFLTAPGVDVRSTANHGGYTFGTGCSFSIPQVSAAAAVMLGIDGTLTPEEIMRLFLETAQDRGSVGYDEYYGYGILNLGGCVAALTGETDTVPDPVQPSEPPEPSEGPIQPDPDESSDDWNPEYIEDEDNPENQQDPSDSSGSSEQQEESGTQDPSDNPEPSGPSKPVTPSGPSDSSKTPEQNDPPGQPDGQDVPDNGEASEPVIQPECPKDESCPMTAFSDLDRTAWYHDGIHYALEKGIMNGYGNGTFLPERSTSRAMVVTMLWRMEGSPVSGSGIAFKDVTEGQWYTDAVRWAVSEEIVNGYSATAFGPDDAVSREQLAVILWRYAVHKGKGTELDIPDQLGRYNDTEQISVWALDAMRWATGSGLIQGVSDERLSPRSDAVRAQVASMLMRFDREIA